MDVGKYLERIAYSGDTTPTYEVLVDLVKAHLYSVPFENLDIHYGNEIVLESNALFRKIVERHRGGFCFELNGLFYELLAALGFDLIRVSARVWEDEEGFSEPLDHMALVVNLKQQQLLVDVGFGRFAQIPLNLEDWDTIDDGREKWQISHPNETDYMVYRLDHSGRAPQYIFDLKPRQLSDFEERSRYHQTSPNSHFTQKRIISKFLRDGRISIAGNMCKLHTKEETRNEEIKSEEDFRSLLTTYFNMTL